jgi:hypothetical protein
MSVSLMANGSEDVRVIAGDKLVLRVNAYDPNGIAKILVQCFQFSMATSHKIKLAVGELVVPQEKAFGESSFEVTIAIPENAALGKWGVQMIEFSKSRG